MLTEKIIKSNEEYLTVYAFLNTEFPPVQWAINRGVLVSSLNTSSKVEAGFISFMHASILQSDNSIRFLNELIIENYRISFSPNKTSRLLGMYFFQSRKDALNRIGDPNWPNYFISDNLVEIRLFSPVDPVVVDANWITYAPLDSEYQLDLSKLDWIEKYWNGIPFNDNPIWEIIADGYAVIPDIEIRQKCRESLSSMFPESIIPLTMAQIVGEIGSNGGMITPFVRRIAKNQIRLDYIWSDHDFHDIQVIEKIKNHPASAYLAKLMYENETWKMPDFRPWSKELEFVYYSQYEKDFISLYMK
jgi:hypothetical protein